MNADQFLSSLGYRSETGWRLSPADDLALGRAVPPRVAGVYLMCANRQLIYAGRSDTCLQTRLVYHEHLHHARVVFWRVCPTAGVAYEIEKRWYERLRGRVGVLNRIEPATPATGHGAQPVHKCRLRLLGA